MTTPEQLEKAAAPHTDIAETVFESVKTCTVKMLPKELWIAAAEKAVQINPGNAPAVQQFSMALPGEVIPPLHLAVLTSKYWGVNGVQLTVGFLDNPAADLRARILSHMNAWGNFSNVKFVETAQNPQVRIARTPASGFWSYLGTDILHIAQNAPTMNLDSFTMNTPDSEFFRVVRHETGHTLGFPHEHMRSEIIDRIDREKAIAYFMRTQGWSRDMVIAQVLTPMANSALIATAHADPNSIMCYWLPAEIMKDNTAVPGGRDIDTQDGQFAGLVYPLRQRQSSKGSPTLTAFANRIWDAFVANNNSNDLLICSSSDGQNWSFNNTRLNQSAKNGSSPSVAVFNNRLYVSFIANNNSNDVLVCSSADGVNWTNNIRINQSAKNNTSPSLAVFNGRLYVTFIANNNSNDVLVCSSADGQAWTNNTRINQAAKDGSSPSLAVFQNHLFVSFTANNNSNDVLVCNSTDGQHWTNNIRINQAAKGGSSPSLAVFSNKLFVSFIANNNSNDVLVCSSANGQNWTNNIRINQAAKTNTSPSLAPFNNRLYVSFIANNNTNEVLLCSSADGQAWTNNIVI